MDELNELYRRINQEGKQGKDTLIPNRESLYLSEEGRCFAYMGIALKEKEKLPFGAWPYYLENIHSFQAKNKIKGFIKLKQGCLVLDNFVDWEYYSKSNYKKLDNFIVRLPVGGNIYFSVEERVKNGDTWDFVENEELTRDCFGLTYEELDKLLSIYSEFFGNTNVYYTHPRLTRSIKSDNFCDITNVWIPPQFPYITFNLDSNYEFSHVSLYGFYKIVSLLMLTSNSEYVKKFIEKLKEEKLYDKVHGINDYFPFETILTREHVYNY